jgi:hypothetical protein
MPTTITERRRRQIFVFYHKSSWAFLRIRELHLVASGQRPQTLQVLDPTIRDEYAPLAYENALASFMAMQSLLNYRNLDALMNQLADFVESNGIEGLEAPLLSGMFGLEGPNLQRPGRTSTLDRLSQVLRNSPMPQPIAGGLSAFPVVDRVGGRINFYTSDGISQLLSDVDSWLGGVDAGMGGVGCFGYGARGGPVFNSFKTRLGELSAATQASSRFCSGYGGLSK